MRPRSSPWRWSAARRHPSPRRLHPPLDDRAVIALVVFLVALMTTVWCAARLVGLSGLGPVVLAAYVIAVAENVVVIEALSLVRGVGRWSLLGTQLLLAASATVVVARRRPAAPDIRMTFAAVRQALHAPPLLVLAAIVAAVWAYLLMIALTVPPNTTDALTYHLPRVVSWLHHGGVYWIPDAPTDRMNEFQAGAEEIVLALFAVAHRPWPYALPQCAAGCVSSSSPPQSRLARLGFARGPRCSRRSWRRRCRWSRSRRPRRRTTFLRLRWSPVRALSCSTGPRGLRRSQASLSASGSG